MRGSTGYRWRSGWRPRAYSPSNGAVRLTKSISQRAREETCAESGEGGLNVLTLNDRTGRRTQPDRRNLSPRVSPRVCRPGVSTCPRVST